MYRLQCIVHSAQFYLKKKCFPVTAHFQYLFNVTLFSTNSKNITHMLFNSEASQGFLSAVMGVCPVACLSALEEWVSLSSPAWRDHTLWPAWPLSSPLFYLPALSSNAPAPCRWWQDERGPLPLFPRSILPLWLPSIRDDGCFELSGRSPSSFLFFLFFLVFSAFKRIFYAVVTLVAILSNARLSQGALSILCV